MLFTAPHAVPPATGGGVQSSGAHQRCCSSRRAPGLHLRATRLSQRMVARATPEPVATKVSASPAVLQPLAPVLVVPDTHCPQVAAPETKPPSERNARDAAAWAELEKQGPGATVECKVRAVPPLCAGHTRPPVPTASSFRSRTAASPVTAHSVWHALTPRHMIRTRSRLQTAEVWLCACQVSTSRASSLFRSSTRLACQRTAKRRRRKCSSRRWWGSA